MKNDTTDKPKNLIANIAVVGAGTMGAGIAQLAATHGRIVRLIDVSEDALHRGLEEIKKHLDRAVEKGRLSAGDRDAAISRISTSTTVSGLAEVDLAIEAVVEDLTIKKQVFATLEQAAPPSAVLATNTSSLPITRIAEAVTDPTRVVGMHFFNPAPIMPLVEIIAGQQSSTDAVDTAFHAARAWGKTPVRVKDTPGFIVNRVARGFYLEALRLLDEGVAGVDEIDHVLRHFGGFRMGPFELMDLIGIDVNLAVSTSVWQQMGCPPRLEPHPIQRLLVESGQIGRKTGRGFYRYESEQTPSGKSAPQGLPAVPVHRRSFQLSPMLADTVRAFAARAGAGEAGSTEQYVFCRILAAIIHEAALALNEGIATQEDIDTAMRLGTNYPKGPLAWAEQIGHRTVRGLLKALNDQTGDDRFAAGPLFTGAE